MKKLIYITHDSWWNSDLPFFPQLSRFFLVNAFVFSSAFYKKQYPNKVSPDVQNIFEFERNYRLKNPLSFISALTFIKAIKKNKSEDSILFYVFGDDFYFNFLLLLFVKRRKIIISIHNYEKHEDSKFFENISKWLTMKHFSNFHFHSQIQYNKFLQDYPSKKAFFTNMAIKDFGPPQKTIKIEVNAKRVFLFFGFIRDYKRLDLFIEAANAVQEPAHFVIAGSSTEWEKYDRLIKDRSKFRCDIKFIDNSQIADYFTQSHFLVLPYSDTTQSGPLLIAYNYSLPIIASDLEMFASMIKPNYNGFLFKSGDVNSLANCLRTACNLTDGQYQEMKDHQSSMKLKYNLTTQKIGEAFDQFISENLI